MYLPLHLENCAGGNLTVPTFSLDAQGGAAIALARAARTSREQVHITEVESARPESGCAGGTALTFMVSFDVADQSTPSATAAAAEELAGTLRAIAGAPDVFRRDFQDRMANATAATSPDARSILRRAVVSLEMSFGYPRMKEVKGGMLFKFEEDGPLEVDEFGASHSVGITVVYNLESLDVAEELAVSCVAADVGGQPSGAAARHVRVSFARDASAATSSTGSEAVLRVTALSAKRHVLEVTGLEDAGGKLLADVRQNSFCIKCTGTLSFWPGRQFAPVSIDAVIYNKRYPWLKSIRGKQNRTSVQSGEVIVFTAIDVFAPGVEVLFGGAGGGTAANVTLSGDRKSLEFPAPSMTQVCDEGKDCYVPFTVRQPVQSRLQVAAKTRQWLSITCGGASGDYCPGDDKLKLARELADTGSIPIDVDGNLRVSAGGDGALKTPNGLFFYDPCTGFDADGSAKCLDPAFASKCAVKMCMGAVCTCKPCPEGALCPAGYRMWPQPGYWAPNDRAGVEKCAPPLNRCAGFSGEGAGFEDATTNLCGTGYRGSRCSSCAQGFWKDGRNCNKCNQQGFDQVAPIFTLGGVMLGIFALVLLLMKYANNSTADTGHDQMRAAGDFCIWMVMMLQTLTQVASASDDLPKSVKSITDFIMFIQIEMPDVPPECIESYPPFTVEALTFFASLALLCVLLAFFSKKVAKRKKRSSFTTEARSTSALGNVRHRIRNMCAVALAVMYAPTLNFAFRQIMCTDVVTQGEPGGVMMERSTVTRSVLTAHPYYSCGAGTGGALWMGMPMYSLAIVVLVSPKSELAARVRRPLAP